MQDSYIARTSGLKASDYIGYAMVDTAGCLVFSLVTTLLQKYYTDIFHLSPLFIMLMFIAARIWDGINDPIMGRICDTVRPSPQGRYRPWILYAAFPLALSAVLMFFRWPGLGAADPLRLPRLRRDDRRLRAQQTLGLALHRRGAGLDPGAADRELRL